MGDRSGWYGAVPLSHALLAARVREGDRVVDATCGNGHDTLFLARLVGGRGHVYAFDIQKDPLLRTRETLLEAGLADRVTLIHAGHETMDDHVPPGVRGVLFNLGFLPGGDREIRTRGGTTCRAIERGMTLLARGGVVVIACYPGHDGGEEGGDIHSFLSTLDPMQWNVWQMRQVNRSLRAPFLFVAERMETG